MKFKILILALASGSAAWATDIDVTPGSLEGMLSRDDVRNTEILKLSGTIDARDLAAIELLPTAVRTLDLSQVSVEGLTLSTRKYFGKTLFTEGEIPGYTFFNSGVENLILPLQLNRIGDGAFAASSITAIEIPEGVTSIGDYAFYGCRNLEQVSLPSTLESIGKGAFANCVSLKTITLPSPVREIPERAFAGDLQLTEISFPASLEKVGREAFSHTSIARLQLSGVREFEPYALSGMPMLEEVNINPEAIIREGLLMDDTSLYSLGGLPEDLPAYFAANCTNLETQDIIAGINTAGKYAFANLKAEKLVLAAGLSRLERGAFSGLSGLTEIDATALASEIPAVDETTFEGIEPENITLIVGDKDYANWEADPEWSRFNLKSESQTNLTSVEPTDDKLIILVKSNLLSIEGTERITNIEIFTADGRLVYAASPGGNKVEIAADSLPGGVLLVKATDAAGNTKTASIMTK